jgi:hypothetical protein
MVAGVASSARRHDQGHLYTVPRNDPRVSEFIEREFLKITDSDAACVLQMFKQGKDIVWTTHTRRPWSRASSSL